MRLRIPLALPAVSLPSCCALLLKPYFLFWQHLLPPGMQQQLWKLQQLREEAAAGNGGFVYETIETRSETIALRAPKPTIWAIVAPVRRYGSSSGDFNSCQRGGAVTSVNTH
jgi:hypothetical protein